MERIELSDGIVEVTHVKVSETTDGLIDEEIKAGCKMLKFTCPKCGGWIGNAVGLKNAEGNYQIIRSGCSSNYEGVDQPCRICQEGGDRVPNKIDNMRFAELLEQQICISALEQLPAEGNT